jgi:hypothetical protein
MEEPKRIPKPLLARLQEHFDQLIPRCLFLVKQDVYPNRVYKSPGSTAIKGNIFVAFKIFQEEELYCEYFLQAEDHTEHRRYFFASDEVELLENLQGQYEEDDLPYEEHMKMVKHNMAVRKLLIKKGFLKK